MKNLRITTIFLIMTCLVAGCGSDTSTAKKMMQAVPVKGVVKLKGKPLTQGSIRFEPEDGGREASGSINPDGSFVMSTFENEDGAVQGLHRVAVVGAGGGKKDPVPIKYHNFVTSGLTLEVTADKTDYVVELK